MTLDDMWAAAERKLIELDVDYVYDMIQNQYRPYARQHDLLPPPGNRKARRAWASKQRKA